MESTGLVIGKVDVPKTFHQLGILVLDGSGSMAAPGRNGLTLAEEVQMSMKEMFARFDASRVKSNFSFAGLKFDKTTSTFLEPARFKDIDYFDVDFDPMNEKGGGTHIFAALDEAEKMAEEFLNGAPDDGVKHSVVILLMSDGLCFEPEKTKAKAAEIKRKYDHKPNPKVIISCAYFFNEVNTNEETNDTKNLLQEVATNPLNYYATVYDGETLRKFFEKSISQASGMVKIG